MAEKQISGSTFVVNPLTGERSFLLQPLILPVLTDILSLYTIFTDAMYDLVDGGTEEIEAKALLSQISPALDRAAPVIDRLCKKLPQDTLKEIVRTLLEGATMDGMLLYTPQGNPIDVKLRGRTLDFWRLLVFAVETSYPDFFNLLGGNRAPAKAPESSAA